MNRSALKCVGGVADRNSSRCGRSAPISPVSLGGVLTKMITTAAANGKTIFFVKRPKDYAPLYRGSFIDGTAHGYQHDIDMFRRCRSEKDIREIFETWIIYFDKVYATAKEKEKRYLIFKRKVRFIEERGLDFYDKGRLGLEAFSDMTPKEYFSMKDRKELLNNNKGTSLAEKK